MIFYGELKESDICIIGPWLLSSSFLPDIQSKLVLAMGAVVAVVAVVRSCFPVGGNMLNFMIFIYVTNLYLYI